MAVAITCNPASPRAATDFCHIAATGVADHAGDWEAGAPVRYRFEARKSGATTEKSHEFTPTPGGEGTHQWDNFAFPSAGSWTLALVDVAGPTDVATQAVTVT